MKKLSEYVTIKNLETAETTTVDDEGNIEGLDGGGDFDFFADDEDKQGLRGDGSHDGLDDLLAAFAEFDEDPFAGDDIGGEGLDDALPGDELGGEEEPMEGELEDGLDKPEGDAIGLGDEEELQPEDPDFQGVIRTVTGACLVYKRKGEEGTFEELWVYNIGKNMRNEVKIRRNILAGTDIPPNDVSSQDGTQSLESTTVGNVQFLRITGLPN